MTKLGATTTITSTRFSMLYKTCYPTMLQDNKNKTVCLLELTICYDTRYKDQVEQSRCTKYSLLRDNLQGPVYMQYS